MLLRLFAVFYLLFSAFNNGGSGILGKEHDSEGPSMLPKLPMLDNSYKEGIFETFVRGLLELLSTNFPERTLTRYCRILNRVVRKMDYRQTKNFAKHLRYLSRMYREDLKDELVKYRKEYDKNLPYRIEFLQTMNQLFTLRENQLFGDYLYDLRDYSNEDRLDVYEQTRKIINVIINSINKISPRDRYELEKKLKRAIREYTHESE